MGSRLRRPTAVAILLILCAAAGGAELPVTTKVLPNGCTLAVVENHQAPVVAIRIYVTRTGSLYEGGHLGSGISHYCEQVVHGGSTTSRTEAETARLLQSIGASTNAYTSRDVTCYYGETHVASFDLMLELMADWMQNCRLDAREVLRERQVVKSEMTKSRDEPQRVAHDMLMDTMFRVHPARHPIAGYLDNFLRLETEDLRRFYRERYAPNNTFVVVAGDVEAEEILDKLEVAFALWERQKDLDHETQMPCETRQMGRRFAEKGMDVREAIVRVGFHTIPLSHPDLYALDLFAAVLGSGRTSRLHRRLVEKDHLTDAVQVGSHTPHGGPGVFHVVAQCPSANVPAFEAALFEEIERLAAAPPTEEELRRAKALVERDFVLDVQRAADQAERVAMDLIGTGNPNYSAQYVERIRAVTGEQVQAMAGKYFSRDNESLVVVKPFGDPPVFGAEGGKKAPAAATETRKIVLPNGFTVVLQHNPATPSVGIEAFFRAGVLWESDENAGISNLMSRLMLRGTKTRTAARIAEELENVGARASAVSGNNTFGMSMSLPARELVPSLALFADLLRNPVFPAEEVEREKRVSQMLIHRQAGNWQTEAMRNFREAMFALHPYRRDRFGTLETIGAIDRDAVVAYHASHCTPANGVLAVFGDLDLDAAEKAVRAAFDDWPKGKALLREVQHEPEPTESRIVTYPSRKEQVVITLGFPGASLDSEDRWALQVIDAAISGLGYPSGRLHESLRGKRDLVYFVHAISWNGFAAGAFYVICPCQPKNYDEVIGIIRREMNRIAEEGLTPEELENAKRMCITVDQLSRQTNNERAMAAALDELYGFGWDAWKSAADRIEKLTNEDIRKAAKHRFAHSVLVLTAPSHWLEQRGLGGER
jgi:zinc protease